MPLAAIAGALGLIWYLASRPASHASRDESAITERTTAPDGSTYRGPASLALRTKYDSVFREAQAQGVQLSDVHQEGRMLMIVGTAPTLEAANKVWNEIKRVNPKLDDIVASFAVMPSAAIPSDSTSSTATEYSTETEQSQTSPSGVASSDTQTYTVKRGDTLSSISKQFYGNTQDYTRIFEARRDLIPNPNVLMVDQVLTIPQD